MLKDMYVAAISMLYSRFVSYIHCHNKCGQSFGREAAGSILLTDNHPIGWTLSGKKYILRYMVNNSSKQSNVASKLEQLLH